MLARLAEKYPHDLRIAYRHFPLDFHDKAALATQASEAAGLQGKFWEMHDLLFQNHNEWASLSIQDFQKWLENEAKGLHLDATQFSKDMTSEEMVALAKQSFEKNATIGLPGTPFVVINGVPYNGSINFDNLDSMVALALLSDKQFTDCPPITVDAAKKYFATLKTVKGEIVLELLADQAPLAVNSFIFLAREGWYDGVTFHRVLPDFVAQAGDPTGTGAGGPGYAFDNEISEQLKFDAPGILGMANAGPGTNGSQFFITYAPTPQLNGGYTIFGRVVSGMDVLKKLSPRDPSKSADLPAGDAILNITIEEK